MITLLVKYLKMIDNGHWNNKLKMELKTINYRFESSHNFPVGFVAGIYLLALSCNVPVQQKS